MDALNSCVDAVVITSRIQSSNQKVNEMSASELFEKYMKAWIKHQQTRFQPPLEEMIREKLNLDDNIKIVWTSEFTTKGEEDES